MLIEKFDEVEELDKAIARLLSKMAESDCDSEEYAKMADQLVKLMKTKQIIAELLLKAEESQQRDAEFLKNLELKKEEAEDAARTKASEHSLKIQEFEDNYALRKRELELKEKEAEKPDRLSKDTLAIVAANVAGILAILAHERVNVIASKALNFVRKI